MKKQRKLRLEMDQLEVETFDTSETRAAGRGTVHAREPVDTSTGEFEGCPCDTVFNTCGGGCAPSQLATCPRPGQCDEGETVYLSCPASCYWDGGQAWISPHC